MNCDYEKFNKMFNYFAQSIQRKLMKNEKKILFNFYR